ncbi:hypothetical protein LV75_004457 [Actinokineospora diospyrosa]|uniref:Uncharacterized protein n=1 Tax=Actinokineospora diospyrosa TaxID=103728 RepID=A0ABT1IH27_9PSEU|nr:hypothetical protein [Actinokineospora diospyrosa]
MARAVVDDAPVVGLSVLASRGVWSAEVAGSRPVDGAPEAAAALEPGLPRWLVGGVRCSSRSSALSSPRIQSTGSGGRNGCLSGGLWMVCAVVDGVLAVQDQGAIGSPRIQPTGICGRDAGQPSAGGQARGLWMRQGMGHKKVCPQRPGPSTCDGFSLLSCGSRSVGWIRGLLGALDLEEPWASPRRGRGGSGCGRTGGGGLRRRSGRRLSRRRLRGVPVGPGVRWPRSVWRR